MTTRASVPDHAPGLKALLLWPALPALILAILVFALDSFFNPNILSSGGLVGFSTGALPLIAASLGQSALLIGRGLDLSMGATISLVNVFAVTLFGHNLGSAAVLPIAIAAAVAVGALEGLLVVGLRINALLATFAVSFVCSGLALWLMPAPGGVIPPELTMFIMGTAGGVPIGLIAIVALAALWIVLKRSVFMLQLYGVGGDPAKAFSSGVPVAKVRVGSYLLNGLFAGIAGISLTFSIGSGDPLIGESYSLLSIAAAVIGGVAIFGGSGDGLGAIFGAIFLSVIPELILGFGVSPFFQQFIVGLIVLTGLGGIVVLQKQLGRVRLRDAELLRQSVLKVAG
jgi:ribose transport system permease protein